MNMVGGLRSRLDSRIRCVLLITWCDRLFHCRFPGLIRQPKWGHLRELHAAVKSCSNALLMGRHKNFSLGQLQEVRFPSTYTDFFLRYELVTQVVCSFRPMSSKTLPENVPLSSRIAIEGTAWSLSSGTPCMNCLQGQSASYQTVTPLLSIPLRWEIGDGMKKLMRLLTKKDMP